MFVCGRDARFDRRLLLLQRSLLRLELRRAGFELRRAELELPLGGRMDSLFVGKLDRALLQLRLALVERFAAMLVQVERAGRRRNPLASLFELGCEDTQLARADVQLPFALAEALGVDRRTLDLLLAIALLFLGEHDAPLTLHELLFGFLDHQAARIEIRADLVEAAGARVDLRGPTCDGLAQQALTIGERRPGLLELVPLVRHSANHAVCVRPQGSALKSIFFNVGGLLIPVVLALAAASPAQATNLGCGSGKLVLSVSYHVVNDVDTGLQGNNWAFDTYNRAVHVWRKAPGRFCSASTYDGEFTTIAGPSPGGKAELPAGIRGTFTGSSVTTFRGAFAPRGAPARGFLGGKDFACTSADQKGQCSGTWDWLRAYFSGISRFKYVRYAFSYHATENGKGTWSDTLVHGKVHAGGDIRPSKK